MTSRSWAVVAVLGVAVAWGALHRGDPDRAPAEAPDELVNRIWIDALPTSAKQKIEVLVLVDEPHFGQFLRTSAYEGDYSLFEWRDRDRDRGRVELTMLQTDETHRVKFEVAGEGCDPFDFCMKVKGAPRGARTYYSMRDWIIEPGRSFGLSEARRFVGARVTAR